MRLALLTTETHHHCLFTEKVLRYRDIHLIISEKNAVPPPFQVSHPFEQQRDLYEESMLARRGARLRDYCETVEVPSVNNLDVSRKLESRGIDMVVVFGASFIKSNILDRYQGRLINLHGGDPEQYRGLDSHLWAIYHNDFDALVSTLHMVNSRLDDGDIIAKANIDLLPITNIYQLRAENTLLCSRLVINALSHHAEFGRFDAHRQQSIGRYYSFMPTCLKAVCAARFEQYVRQEANTNV